MKYIVIAVLNIVAAGAAFCQPEVASTAPSVHGDLVIQLPADDPIRSASAASPGQKAEFLATVRKSEASFSKVPSEGSWDVKVTLQSGNVLQGIDLRWYTTVAERGNPQPLADDDRAQIHSSVQDVKDFYNRKHVLLLTGDADRAVALVRLLRDTDFYAGKGEIIWRIELWYFENQAGGWAAVRQQHKIVRRERFKDPAAYKTATGSLRFVAKLGGLPVEAGKANIVALTKEEIEAAPAGYLAPEHK